MGHRVRQKETETRREYGRFGETDENFQVSCDLSVDGSNQFDTRGGSIEKRKRITRWYSRAKSRFLEARGIARFPCVSSCNSLRWPSKTIGGDKKRRRRATGMFNEDGKKMVVVAGRSWPQASQGSLGDNRKNYPYDVQWLEFF